jgi:class 3 adenylate cyclase
VETNVAKSKTQIVSVLFVDIVGYSKRSVTQQVEIKRAFNAHLGDALSPVLADDWILLDTGDGAAIAFQNSPEEALLTSDRLMALAYPEGPEHLYSLRSGLHLGPVVVVRDVNGSVNLVGDAINDAQRIMSFAGEDEVFSSRQYAELVARIDTSYGDRFSSMGYMQDKHGRAHDLARVAPAGYRIPKKISPVKDAIATALASNNAAQPVIVDSSPPVASAPAVAVGGLPGKALMLGALAVIAVVGWLFWRGNKPAEAPPVPALQNEKAGLGVVAVPPKATPPATSAGKSVQESKKPSTASSEVRPPIATPRPPAPGMESFDCRNCSCTDLLARVSRGAPLTTAETSFLRTKCQWQDSPQSGGVAMSPSLTKRNPASVPTQQTASPAPQAQVQSKPPEKVQTDVRQSVAPSGQATAQSIPDCPYCSCPDLLTKVSLGVSLSSAETRFLRTKCQ